MIIIFYKISIKETNLKYQKFNTELFLNINNLWRKFCKGYSTVIQENHIQVRNKIEGIHIIYQNIQLQQTLMKRHDYNGLEIGMDLAYFIDIGISAKSFSSFKMSNGIIGYGIGVRLFVSGLGVISFDFGFNPYGSWYIHPSD